MPLGTKWKEHQGSSKWVVVSILVGEEEEEFKIIIIIIIIIIIKQNKTIPLQAWTGPEGSRRLRLPDYKTIGT